MGIHMPVYGHIDLKELKKWLMGYFLFLIFGIESLVNGLFFENSIKSMLIGIFGTLIAYTVCKRAMMNMEGEKNEVWST